MIDNNAGERKEQLITDGGETGDLISSTDWSKTDLGPIKNWPQSLRTLVNVCLYSHFPVIIMWGNNFTQIYNDAYCDILADKHPKAMGASAKNTWQEVWGEVGNMLQNVLKEKKTLSLKNVPIFINRKGFLEECYFTFSYSPVFNETGDIGGIYAPVIETTEEVIRQRRFNTLDELDKNISNRKSVQEIYFNAVKTFQNNKQDFPFTLIYSIEKNGIEAKYIAGSGIDNTHIAAPVVINRRAEKGWSKYVNEVINTNKPIIVKQIDSQFDNLPKGMWEHAPNAALILPISKNAKAIPFAVLIIALNPYLLPDEKYLDFYKSVTDRIVSEVSTLLVYNAEKERDLQLRKLFSKAPIAICLLKGAAHIVQIANERMLALWGKPAGQMIDKPLFDGLTDARGQGFEEILKKVYTTGERFVTQQQQVNLVRDGAAEDIFVKFVFEPVYEDDGNISGILVVADEITEQVKAKIRTEESELQMRNIFMQAPAAIATLTGPEHVFESANPFYKKLVGKSELIGLPGRNALPELNAQGIWDIFDTVYKTGEPFIGSEFPVKLDRLGNGQLDKGFFNFIIQPIKNRVGHVERLLVHAVEITAMVNARKSIEEIETSQKLAIEAAAIGTFDWNIPASKFKYSGRLAAIFGYEQTANLNQESFASRIHPEDQQMRINAHKEAFKKGKLFYEARVIWPDNSLHWVRLNGKVIYDNNGNPSKLYGTTLDITDQKLAAEELERKVEERTVNLKTKNEELKKSEERYHKMIEEVHDYAIIMLDINGNILNWNKGAQKIKGYSEEEIVNKNFSNFYLPEDIAVNLPKKLIETAKHYGRATHEGWRVRKDGTTFWGSIVITALHGEQGEIIGFTKVTRDLTERKLAEDKMKQYAAELEIQNKELEQFAYIASHDLQEPLRKIQTFSDMIQSNLEDIEMSKKYFAKIDASAKRMEELIKSVLNYSRLSQLNKNFVATDLNIILENIKVDFELLIQEKNVTVTSDLLPTIQGIPLQLTQLFSNLINNAIKFSEAEPDITITAKIITDSEVKSQLKLQDKCNYVELVFKDNGIGFDQIYADRIFTIFQRLHTKQSYSGTGIGLALCKRIVDNHNGAIHVKSEPGVGSQFYIYLPA